MCVHSVKLACFFLCQQLEYERILKSAWKCFKWNHIVLCEREGNIFMRCNKGRGSVCVYFHLNLSMIVILHTTLLNWQTKGDTFHFIIINIAKNGVNSRNNRWIYFTCQLVILFLRFFLGIVCLVPFVFAQDKKGNQKKCIDPNVK